MRMKPMYYRRDGTPYISNDPKDEWGTLQWGRDIEQARKDGSYWIGRTRLWWGGKVSTIWLGLDHSHGNGPPLIFETMVFGWRPSSVLANVIWYVGVVLYPTLLTDEQKQQKFAKWIRRWLNTYTPDMDEDRYASESSAKVGHRIMVMKWSNPWNIVKWFADEIAWKARYKWVIFKGDWWAKQKIEFQYFLRRRKNK